LQKKGLFVSTVAATVAAAIVRIFITLYHTDTQTGKIDSPLWQLINTAIFIVFVLISVSVYFKKYTDYNVEIPQHSIVFRSFSVLAAIASLICSVYCIMKYIASPYETFSIYAGAAAIISAVLFLYIGIAAHKIKKDLVLYLSIGPVVFFLLRIIEIFNLYSRNISLYTYKYEIVGLCCMIMLFVLFIAAAIGKTSAKSSLFFALCGFSFLLAYSIPQILLPLFGKEYFTNNAPSYYAYSDLLFGICALYFGTLLKPKKNVKH